MRNVTRGRQYRGMAALGLAWLLAIAAVSCSAGVGRTATEPGLRVSLDATRVPSFPLHGALLLGDAYVFLAVGSSAVEEVAFSLGRVGAEVTWEALRVAPFDLMGTERGRGMPWDTRAVENGRYRLVAEARWRDGVVVESTAEFTIDNIVADGPPDVWRPAPGTTWQWQLTGTIDTSVEAEVFDIDLFDAPPATIAALRAAGRHVICYFSAGSHESWRPDAGSFPDAVIGKRMTGWSEDWLDVRRIDLLAPIMRARLDLAAEKGCDAVEPDNVDAYLNDTGFPITMADQVRYNRFLAEEAHVRGLAIGLKNAVELVPELLGHFDFAVNEECYRWNECERLQAFVWAGKAVFGAEYDLPTAEFCPVTNALGLDFILKRRDLGVFRESCR